MLILNFGRHLWDFSVIFAVYSFSYVQINDNANLTEFQAISKVHLQLPTTKLYLFIIDKPTYDVMEKCFRQN